MSRRFPAPSHPACLSPEETALSRQTVLPAILIVDDDPDILTALYDLLEHDSFRVTGVSTCRDALTQVKTADFAAVLLDIGLPDGDRQAVLETIQAIAPSLPVIILTAFTSQDYRARSLSAADSPASPNHTIAMSCVPYYTRPLGWPDHPLLSITDAVGMMGSLYPSAHSIECGTHQQQDLPATATTPVQILFMTQLSFGSIGQNEGGIKLKLPDQTQWLLK